MPKIQKNRMKNKSACMCALLIICLLLSGCGGQGHRGSQNPTQIPLTGITVTSAPEYSVTSGVSPTLQPTYTIEPTITGSVPTPTSHPSEIPTVTPEITKVPTMVPTVTKVPTKIPTVTVSPTPEVVTPGAVTPSVVTPGAVTVSPAPEVSVTPNPEISITPEPMPTLPLTPMPTVKPEPTPAPDYDALMNGGWQRTEDFYGSRDIYFSAGFEPEGMVTEPERYGFFYYVPDDDSVSLSVMGEDGVTASRYREQLQEQYFECEIIEEQQEDYTYRYRTDDVTVYGRVYTTRNGENVGRMRIELSYRGDPDKALEEGYFVYLKEK